MASPLIPPKFQAFAGDGSFLVGGKLYTYEPGTTTPKATYTSATLGVANANPVILDARGEANVWPDGTTKYVLKDSADATIWTVDSVGAQVFEAHSFQATKNGTDQTGILSATSTKITFGTEDWDTAGWYDTGTSRFTPLVAGRYRIMSTMYVSGGVVDANIYTAAIFRNGSVVAQDARHASSGNALSICVDKTLTMNGSTDYVEVYFTGGGAGNKTIAGGTSLSWFAGYLIEAT